MNMVPTFFPNKAIFLDGFKDSTSKVDLALRRGIYNGLNTYVFPSSCVKILTPGVSPRR